MTRGIRPFSPPSLPAVLRTDERPACHAIVLAKVANYAALRRYLGRSRAALLIHDVADRILTELSDGRIVGVARDEIEIEIVTISQAEADRITDAIDVACREPFNLDGELHDVQLILGVAAGDSHDDDVLLAERAEHALADALAREAGGELLTLPVLPARKDLVADLVRAIDADEMVLFYQPKTHVRRQEITSAEALIRWQHPDRGLILPGDFITLAERAGVIDRLTLWAIDRVIADQRRLTEAGRDLRLFVNISGQLLADEAFVTAACRKIAAAEAQIGFEVTETSVIRDPQSAIANLQRFADIGIRIAIDDYGAGLSSLAYLKELPARELKIDKLFVTQLTSSNRDPLIVRSTIDLAHALEMEVVAEGVEDHAALALLTVMGCDMVQGFLISRPVTLDALIAFLNEGVHQRAAQDTRSTMTRLASAWKRA